MRYKPINFIVLRTSGTPFEKINKLNFSDKLLKKIHSDKFCNNNTSLMIKREIDKSVLIIKNIAQDYRMRDMMRISSQNYSIFLRKLLDSESLLSQYQRKFLMYLQRGTTKCCTAGSYGPVAIGEFEHAADNLSFFKTKGDSFIMIESWALDLMLNKLGIKISEEKYHKIIENYLLLKELDNKKLNELVEIISKYKNCKKVSKKDKIYNDLLNCFNKITGMVGREFIFDKTRSKDYESRAVIYELDKRDFSFQMGNQLKEDIDRINDIFGIYLTLLTKEFLDNIKKNNKLNTIETINTFIFRNFKRVSEKVIKQIILKKIKDYSNIDYKYTIMPPIFSPDITIASNNVKNLNDSNYSIILGEIHVSPTIISNPMYEFEREKLLDVFTSSLKGITNNKIIFKHYTLNKSLDFTHHLPLGFQKELFSLLNKTANNNKTINNYRTNEGVKNKKDLFNLLFFPLNIGKKLIFNGNKDKKIEMWSRDYFPDVIKRIARKLYPLIDKKLLLREEKKIKTIHISPPASLITTNFIFKILKESHNWKKENNLEDEIFLRYDPNRKPVYINFKNPFLVYEMLKSINNLEMVYVSPALPKNNCNWLSDKEGHYYSEFRYMVCPFVDSEEIKKPQNKLNLIYLPGYKSRLDELNLVKETLFHEGINVESLILDYNQKFEQVNDQIVKYVRKKYVGKIYIMGLSFGGVLAFKLARRLGSKVSRIFSLNPFYERRNVPNLKNFENLSVKDFFPKNITIVIISAEDDKSINIENSISISKLDNNVKLYKLKTGGHTFSNKNAQKKVEKLIISEIK